MKYTSSLLFLYMIIGMHQNYAQSTNEEEKEPILKEESKENISEEVITKTIRIKGANGEEKVIKQQQVISKKRSIKLDPQDKNKTNINATYTPEEVTVKNYGKTSTEKLYSSIPDRAGYIFTFIDENGERMSKAQPISNGYYLINNGQNDNCVGHFDENKNLVLEMFDTKKDSIIQVVYKQN